MCILCADDQPEDHFHFFYVCPFFAQERIQLFDDLHHHFQPPKIIPDHLNDFLFGNNTLTATENDILSKVVQKFIVRTRRFTKI